nr:haloacid dehalogenase-like hydrolase [Pseudomonadota bacterium]
MKSIAFFDFDGTLVRKDTLLFFLAGVVGWPVVVWAFVRATCGVLTGQRGELDLRTRIKERLLRHTLAGVPLERTHPAAESLKTRMQWLEPQVQALLRHKAMGHRIVIATGALRLYMPG